MSLKDLPKSLVDAVSEVVETSAKHDDALTLTIIKEGLKKFGFKGKTNLTEAQEKVLYSWCKNEFEARKLQEAMCSCGVEMSEDDMPGDEVYHKHGDEDAEKKKELDEEDDELEASSKIVSESIAILPNQLATNGAVGVTDASMQMPVHADVLRDSNPVDGTHEYRLFVQFNTNTMPTIVPPVVLPGAPSVEALRDVVEGLPYFGEMVEKAFAEALDAPHKQPAFAGDSE